MAINKVEWNIDFAIEFDNFNKKDYEEFLNPAKVGSFKEAKESYYNYLQAKGRGEDVKCPFTFDSLKKPEEQYYDYKDKNFLNPSTYLYCVEHSPYTGTYKVFSDNVRVESKLHISIDGKEPQEINYNELNNTIAEAIKISSFYGNFNSSREIDLFEEQNKNPRFFYRGLTFNWHFNKDDFTGYVSITDPADKEMQLEVDFEYNPLLRFEKNKVLTVDISNAYFSYVEDKDPEERLKEALDKKENGDYYNVLLTTGRGVMIDGEFERLEPKEFDKVNLDPAPEVELIAFYTLKSKEKTSANYHRLCDPEKISFKEFKDSKEIALSLLNKNTIDNMKKTFYNDLYYINSNKLLSFDFAYNTHYDNPQAIGKKKIMKLMDDLISKDHAVKISERIDMSDNIKHYFDEDLEVSNLKDYGNEIGGEFVFRNIEYEFEYNTQTGELNLARYDYEVEDPETGYYRQVDLPPLLENSAIQEMIADQLDFHCTKFIAENRYGSFDEMVKAAGIKASKTISTSKNSKEELEM